MRKSMSAWIRRGSIILLTMLLLLTAAVAENAQIPILIDGVRVAFFDADGNLLTPKAENGLLYVPLQAFCENMGLSAEVQGQSVAVDGTRIGMFDEAGNFLTPVQMDGVDYVPLAPFCNALGIQIAEENGGFAVTRKKAEQPAAETKAQTGKIALTEYNFDDYFSYSLEDRNFQATQREAYVDSGAFRNSVEVDYVVTCNARSAFEIENVTFTLYGFLSEADQERCGFWGVAYTVDMPANGSYSYTYHKSDSAFVDYISDKATSAALETTFVKQVSGYLIVEREKADAANLASFQKGEELMEAGEFSDAEKIFSALNTIGYSNAQEKYDEAETKYKEAEKVRGEAAEKAEQERAENYQKAVALEEAEDYEQAISIYEGLGDYKDCAERFMACNEKNEKKTKYQTAVQKEEDGDYSGAFQAYEELGDYKDSIARASFCVKKYQALNRIIKYTSEHDGVCDEFIYSYDEQGFPQSMKKKAKLSYTESYIVDSDGFIFGSRYEGQWLPQEGHTVIADVAYDDHENEVFRRSTYRSPDNQIHQDGAILTETREYTYDEYDNMLKMKISDGMYEREYTYKYEYDVYGRIETKTELKNQEVIYKAEYFYDDNGILWKIKYDKYFNNDEKNTWIDTYTYAYYGTERVRTEEGLAEHRERMNQLIEEAQKEPEKTYTMLKPGSNGQEVLDARMKLYELGYFKKKPTQTEYTDSMADYVKKFEKDHGLTQDGVLSPEDQEVLFGL